MPNRRGQSLFAIILFARLSHAMCFCFHLKCATFVCGVLKLSSGYNSTAKCNNHLVVTYWFCCVIINGSIRSAISVWIHSKWQPSLKNTAIAADTEKKLREKCVRYKTWAMHEFGKLQPHTNMEDYNNIQSVTSTWCRPFLSFFVLLLPPLPSQIACHMLVPLRTLQNESAKENLFDPTWKVYLQLCCRSKNRSKESKRAAYWMLCALCVHWLFLAI